MHTGTAFTLVRKVADRRESKRKSGLIAGDIVIVDQSRSRVMRELSVMLRVEIVFFPFAFYGTHLFFHEVVKNPFLLCEHFVHSDGIIHGLYVFGGIDNLITRFDWMK